MEIRKENWLRLVLIGLEIVHIGLLAAYLFNELLK